VPLYRAGEEPRFLEEFLDVVFAEVGVRLLLLGGWLMEREDVGCGLEFRNGYKANLALVSSVNIKMVGRGERLRF
jgi:hypothetical protein